MCTALLQKSFHYIGLLKAVMRLSVTALKAADAKDVASSVNAIANEKLKAEKAANAGKKKTGMCFYCTLTCADTCEHQTWTRTSK
jgi:hypothetical protein